MHMQYAYVYICDWCVIIFLFVISSICIFNQHLKKDYNKLKWKCQHIFFYCLWMNILVHIFDKNTNLIHGEKTPILWRCLDNISALNSTIFGVYYTKHTILYSQQL